MRRSPLHMELFFHRAERNLAAERARTLGPRPGLRGFSPPHGFRCLTFHMQADTPDPIDANDTRSTAIINGGIRTLARTIPLVGGALSQRVGEPSRPRYQQV